jgi:hypothetical protein
MRLKNREEILTLIFQGVVNRVIVGESANEDGTWEGYYLAANGEVIAHLSEGRSREHIIEKVKTCMHGHAKQVFENLFQDSETYLGSMGLQPTTTNKCET